MLLLCGSPQMFLLLQDGSEAGLSYASPCRVCRCFGSAAQWHRRCQLCFSPSHSPSFSHSGRDLLALTGAPGQTAALVLLCTMGWGPRGLAGAGSLGLGWAGLWLRCLGLWLQIPAKLGGGGLVQVPHVGVVCAGLPGCTTTALLCCPPSPWGWGNPWVLPLKAGCSWCDVQDSVSISGENPLPPKHPA